jgi:hypothetical protein
MKNDIIYWWSGGVTSAVACKVAIDIYGIDRNPTEKEINYQLEL